MTQRKGKKTEQDTRGSARLFFRWLRTLPITSQEIVVRELSACPHLYSSLLDVLQLKEEMKHNPAKQRETLRREQKFFRDLEATLLMQT